MRPISIVRFERLYGLAILFNLVAAVVMTPRLLARSPAPAPLSPTTLVMLAGLSMIVDVGLLILASRRGSAVARWILVVWTSIGVVSFLLGLFGGRAIAAVSLVMAAAVLALKMVALAQTFRPDARDWYAGQAA